MRSWLCVLWLAGAAALSGCARGYESGRCFPNGTCRSTLTCLSKRCVAVPAKLSAAAARAAASARGAPGGPGIWAPRTALEAVVWRGAIWLIAGYTDGGANNDVWTSTDARTWTRVESSGVSWSPRAAPAFVLHDDRLFVLGGLDDAAAALGDVWSSTDGVHWKEPTATAPWAARSSEAVSFHGRLWLVAGSEGGAGRTSFSTLHDVWNSADGATWARVTDTPPWPARGAHALAVFADRLWIVGGYTAEMKRLGDVWSSPDGLTWTEAPVKDAFGAREGHELVVRRGELCVVSGAKTDYVEWDDVWCSKDGTAWTELPSHGPDWYPRKYFTAVAWGDSILALGGWSRTRARTNGTWREPAPPAKP